MTKRGRSVLAFAALAFAVTAVAPAQITGVVKVEKVARLTGTEGSESMNPTWEVGIGGTDLGHMVNFKGRTYLIFGDTFSSELAHQNKPGTGEGWRWNAVAYTTDTLAADGVTFTGWVTDETGRAREIIHDSRDKPITNIPTGAVVAEDRIYVWYMAMAFWGTKEDPCWRSHYSGLAWSEDGKHYTIQEDFRFPAGSNFGMVAALHGNDDPTLRDGYVYVWGTPTNRCGGVKLARVRPGEIARMDAWRYYAGDHEGTPQWVNDEDDATTILQPRVGEMSVMYNEWAGVWTMLYITFLEGQNPVLHTGRIVLRQAPAPWGPWSDPIEVVVPNQFLGGLYGSYMNPLYVENRGETVYFTMSFWHPYDVYWWKVKFRKSAGRSGTGIGLGSED